MPEGQPRRTLRDLASVLFAHWAAIVAITAVIAAATFAACTYSQKIYESRVTMSARQPRSSGSLLQETPDTISPLEVFLKRQREIIFSDHVLKRTVARLSDDALAEQPSETGPAWEQWDAKVQAAADKIPGREASQFRRGVEVTTPGGEDVGRSEVFTIAVEQPGSPERAQRAASILAEEYLLRERQRRAEVEQEAQQLLERQLDDLRTTTLDTAERRFNDFITQKVKGNLLELAQLGTANSEVYHQRILTAFKQDMLKLDAEISEYKALQAEVKRQVPQVVFEKGLTNLEVGDLEGVAVVVPEAIFKRNPIIDKLKKKLADLLIVRHTLMEQYNEDYKLLRQNAGEVFRTNVAILQEMLGELQAIDQHIVTLEARKAEIARQVEDQERAVNEVSSLFVEYQSLVRELDLARSLYEQRRHDLLNAETTHLMAQSEILVTRLEDATLPDADRPVRPILWLYTLVAGVAGLLLGTSYAFVVDSYDHSVRSIDQAERYFGLPVAVSVTEVRGGIIR